MRGKSILLGLMTLAVTHVFAADEVVLKDNAVIKGSILADKPDQLVVDVGYTVLVIPRDRVSLVNKGDALPEALLIEPELVRSDDSLYISATRELPESSVRELVQRLGEAVVQVKTPGGLGSGFFINEDGYLITNFHVIEGETDITIEVYHEQNGQLERRSYKDVRIVAMNKFADLTLLKIEDAGRPDFVPVPLGSFDELEVGERVFAIGSPLGLERTVTEGILSTKTRQVQGELYLQTTTQINPGNSGGPLFNLRGEVVGVTNMKLTFAEGLGFAIPVTMVKFFLKHRDAYAYDRDNPSNAFRYLDPPAKVVPGVSE